jgi:hypothetical protein
MSKWVKKLIVSLMVFNLFQLIGWSILLYPSVTKLKNSIGWIVFMSWYANWVGAIAALGTSIIMVEQMRKDKEDASA